MLQLPPLALAFAWFLGFGATIAEPTLSALGLTAEELTNGVFKKKTVIMAVSMGVAFAIALGLAKLIFNLPLTLQPQNCPKSFPCCSSS